MDRQKKPCREITKSRLIAALLAELEASRAMIVSESVSSGEVFNNTIACDFRVPFEESRVSFDTSNSEADELQCVCCYAGQRFIFTLTRSSPSIWHLPKSVQILDMRTDLRLSFPQRMYSAEIISERGAIYGYAIDINRDFMALDVEITQKLKIGDRVKVLIRMVNTSIDVFYKDCLVAQIKNDGSDIERIILDLSASSTSRKDMRQHHRKVVTSASINLGGSPFVDHREEFNLVIQNISTGGMTLSRRVNDAGVGLPAGTILNSKELRLSFFIVWENNQNYGVRPLLSDPQALARWYQFVDQVLPPEDHKASTTRRELAEILTHSGLLKGSRRKPFGRALEDHLVAENSGYSPLVLQRRVVSDSSGSVVLHVNLKRISESGWLLSDGAATTEQRGFFQELMRSSASFTRSMMTHSSHFPRYMTVLWQDAVKSTGEFTQKLQEQGDSSLFLAVQISIKSYKSIGAQLESQNNLVDLYSLSSSSRRDVNNKFAPMLYEAFVGFDGSHPILNAELGKMGPYHHAKTKVLLDDIEAPIIAHRIFTHNVWSLTGVSNSLFILIPTNTSTQRLNSALHLLSHDEISYGTDDMLLIFDGDIETREKLLAGLPKPMKFSFLIHDLLSNESLKYQDKK